MTPNQWLKTAIYLASDESFLIFIYLFVYVRRVGSSVAVLHLLLVAARGTLSCSTWGLVPQPGIEPEPSAWGAPCSLECVDTVCLHVFT